MNQYFRAAQYLKLKKKNVCQWQKLCIESAYIFSAGVSRLQIDTLRTSWCRGEEREKSVSRGE